MISLAHITQGDAVRNTTLSRTLPGALTKAFISEWIQPQLPGTAESQRLGRPRALPLYPMASTFSSVWSVTTVPTCSRAQVERLARSSAIRMYTTYRGTRSGRDRKSTRLNSSHLVISYAVFCLKKKTNYPSQG